MLIDLQDIQRLRLEPGDVLVLRMPDRLTAAAVEHLANTMQDAIPGHKVIVLEKGAQLEVVSGA
jgi:hypothetical protein